MSKMRRTSRRVYVVNNGGHDYSGAAGFGELIYCTEGALRKDDTAQMYRELSAYLDDAESNDLLLLTSLTTLCCVASAIMAARFGEVHFLLFKEGQYVERTVVIDMD